MGNEILAGKLDADLRGELSGLTHDTENLLESLVQFHVPAVAPSCEPPQLEQIAQAIMDYPFEGNITGLITHVRRVLAENLTEASPTTGALPPEPRPTGPYRVAELIKDTAVWKACRFEVSSQNSSTWTAICWNREDAEEVAAALNSGVQHPDPSSPRTINVSVAKLLEIRDQIIKGDYAEAYHILYSIADPEFCEFEPWQTWEEIALESRPEEPKP